MRLVPWSNDLISLELNRSSLASEALFVATALGIRVESAEVQAWRWHLKF